MTNIKPMENKDIDKAAREYALKRYPEECGDDAYEAGLRTGYRNGYVDSHISRQSEIDELIEALEEFHNLLEEHLPNWYLRGHHVKATQLLEKYVKK